MASWRFRSLRSFFGLSENDAEYIYEEIFQLKHHGGWSFIEAYNLPLLLRKWFLRRLQRQFDDEAKAAEKAHSKNKTSSM
tara:strand:+ start:167 stop:406 length:240 start_codon:yes stop_codon:yes gene_type:complete